MTGATSWTGTAYPSTNTLINQLLVEIVLLNVDISVECFVDYLKDILTLIISQYIDEVFEYMTVRGDVIFILY